MMKVERRKTRRKIHHQTLRLGEAADFDDVEVEKKGKLFLSSPKGSDENELPGDRAIFEIVRGRIGGGGKA